MKLFVSLAALFAACELMAFDSAEWHGKRELFAREAERLMGVYSNCAARATTPAQNVQIPIETYSDGSVKMSVSAQKAQYFIKEGLVWAECVVVIRFNPSGSIEARIDARNCVVDRKTRSGWAEGLAQITYGKTKCSGSGVFFSATDSYVRIFENARVESSDLRFGGVKR